MSFLDLLSCALGGTLLLLLLVQQKSQQQLEAARKEIEELQEQQQKMAALTGLGGELRNVVFVFDTSGSMGNGFDYYKTAFCEKVRALPAERFNVVQFSSGTKVWRNGTMVARSNSEVDAACKFIESFTAGGGTDTLAALRDAYSLPGVDTIILFSDGNPSGEIGPILSYVDSRPKNIVLNTVAIGDGAHVSFLRTLSELGGGQHSGM